MLMGTNFGSSFHMCQLAYPLLKASGAGHVVFTSSVSGFVSLKNMSVHGASKGNTRMAHALPRVEQYKVM